MERCCWCGFRISDDASDFIVSSMRLCIPCGATSTDHEMIYSKCEPGFFGQHEQMQKWRCCECGNVDTDILYFRSKELL